jgi:hypothetical protein
MMACWDVKLAADEKTFTTGDTGEHRVNLTAV